MNIDGLISGNCLFLICPTDGMEPLLAENFKGQAFFYTALGACFEWDIKTQKELVRLVEEKSIKQIALVAKLDNRFFIEKLNVKFNLADYPIEKTLQFVEDEMPSHWDHCEAIIPKQEVLAANYFEHQKSRLLNTSILGRAIANKEIQAVSFLYNCKKNRLLKTEKLMHRITLFESISIN